MMWRIEIWIRYISRNLSVITMLKLSIISLFLEWRCLIGITMNLMLVFAISLFKLNWMKTSSDKCWSGYSNNRKCFRMISILLKYAYNLLSTFRDNDTDNMAYEWEWKKSVKDQTVIAIKSRHVKLRSQLRHPSQMFDQTYYYRLRLIKCI